MMSSSGICSHHLHLLLLLLQHLGQRPDRTRALVCGEGADQGNRSSMWASLNGNVLFQPLLTESSSFEGLIEGSNAFFVPPVQRVNLIRKGMTSIIEPIMLLTAFSLLGIVTPQVPGPLRLLLLLLLSLLVLHPVAINVFEIFVDNTQIEPVFPVVEGDPFKIIVGDTKGTPVFSAVFLVRENVATIFNAGFRGCTSLTIPHANLPNRTSLFL